MKRFALIWLMVITAAFGWGLFQLFQLRFASGDVYPGYSSLRADPLGTMALYESLQRLMPAERHYRPLSRLGEGRQTTLLFLGVEAHDLSFNADEFRDLESFVSEGGRLVISFFPTLQKPKPNPSLQTAQPAPGRKRGANSPPAEEEEAAGRGAISIQERWKLSFQYLNLPKDDQGAYLPMRAVRQEGLDLPASLTWHSALYFENLDGAWRTLYALRKGQAVLMERHFRRGTIVLSSDTYYLSNEALLKERHSGLISWLVGGSRRVLFDEAHLGVAQSSGVVTLARQYRLHGFATALLALAGLFIWKSSARFMPPSESARRPSGEFVTGKETAAGFINLLRRNLPAQDLLPVCLLEWKKSFGHTVARSKLDQIQAVMDAENERALKDRNPVGTYRAISRILCQTKIKP